MTRRPWLVALLVGAGAMALVYNVKVYSALFAQPNPSSEAPAAIVQPDQEADRGEAAAPQDDAGSAAPLVALAPARLDAFLAGLASVDRDPFRFASEQAAPGQASEVVASKTPTVEGVLIGEGRRVAFIDGRARSEGEEVAGHVIVRIESGRVVLVFQGREIEVPAPH